MACRLPPVFRFGLPALLLALFSQCGTTSEFGSAGPSKTVGYQAGVPNFDMEVVATWRDGQPGIDIYIGIPYRSLTFVRLPSQFAAVCQTTVVITNWESRDHVLEREWLDSVAVSQYGETQSFTPFSMARRIGLGPGTYRVEVRVQDGTSGKSAIRSQGVEITPLTAGQPAMSALWLHSHREDGRFEPVVALHVPSDIGPLRASAMVYNLHSAEDLRVEWLLLKIASDTSAASPPYYIYQQLDEGLFRRGVDFDRKDTTAMKQEPFSVVRKDTTLEFFLPTVDDGMYILFARILGRVSGDSRDTLLLQSRYDLSVKGPHFPRPSTLEALIGPLSYIAKEEELTAIRSATTPQEQRKEFELYWLKLTGNQQAASNLIRQYYTRVEEANLRFTTYKAGWKTDRGMVYIILGPPISVTTRASDEIWMYSYDETDPLSLFVFERVRETATGPAFPNYMLVRRSYYSTMWDRTVQRWRSGSIQ